MLFTVTVFHTDALVNRPYFVNRPYEIVFNHIRASLSTLYGWFTHPYDISIVVTSYDRDGLFIHPYDIGVLLLWHTGKLLIHTHGKGLLISYTYGLLSLPYVTIVRYCYYLLRMVCMYFYCYLIRMSQVSHPYETTRDRLIHDVTIQRYCKSHTKIKVHRKICILRAVKSLMDYDILELWHRMS